MEDLKVGDVVYLKSGSVKMTIETLNITEDSFSQCICIWHDAKGKLQKKNYNPETLTKSDPSIEPPLGVTI
jgi:uncharacterized protein YodC (DUF2158 family)